MSLRRTDLHAMGVLWGVYRKEDLRRHFKLTHT